MTNYKCGCLPTKALLLTLVTVSISTLSVFSETLSERQKTDPTAAKAANIGAARQLNEDSAPLSSTAKTQARTTAAVVNQVPGVKVAPRDLEPPRSPPIRGFHPIKKLLQPVENLEGMSIKLEQQIMKLEGPIAALNPPMVNLQTKMTKVNDTMGKMQNQLNGVDGQMHGVRTDLAKMRVEISDLKVPILSIEKPLAGVSRPLEAVERQLNLVLLAIVAAAVAIVIGTPIAAIVLYRYRHKLFPAKTVAALPQEREKALR